MTDEDLMRLAIAKASEGIAQGQTPFGACIARSGQPVVCAHNQVWASGDVTAHAEVAAIREACRLLGTIDLSGCTIYSTCEPCPMCFAACHWARLDRIVYAARIEDASAAGFHELPVSNVELKRLAGSPVELAGDVLRDEGAALFREWAAQPGSKAY